MMENSNSFSLSRPELWDLIRHAELPKPRSLGTCSSFSEGLKEKSCLTPESASRLEAEYRRYLYLLAICDRPLSPSSRVKDAWDLHEEATGDAWWHFCAMILDRQSYHRIGPSSEEAKDAFARTLDLYRHEFDEEPPTDIWPGKREKMRALFGKLIIGLAVASLLAVIFFSPMGREGDPRLIDLLGFLVMCLAPISLGALGGWLLDGTDLEDGRDFSGGWWG